MMTTRQMYKEDSLIHVRKADTKIIPIAFATTAKIKELLP